MVLPAGKNPSHESADRTLPRPRGGAVGAPAVELAVEEVLPDGGALLRRLVVADESATSSTREVLQREAAHHDAQLRQHPEWPATQIVDGRLHRPNPAGEWFYTSPTMREWRRELVPGAAALYPVQRPGEAFLPSGGAIDDLARSIFTNALDSIGIRTRARVMTDVVLSNARRGRSTGGRPSWVSLACGAAVPVLDAVRSLAGTATADPHLHLVDVDPGALEFARQLAVAQGLVEGVDFSTLERDLVTGVVARDQLVTELGAASADVVDAVGIFEYFRDASCVRLLRNAHRLLRPGGVLVVANMLADRPELALNQRAIGWPRLHPRSVEQLLDLVRRAGLPLDRTTVSIPADGVYAVVDVRA